MLGKMYCFLWEGGFLWGIWSFGFTNSQITWTCTFLSLSRASVLFLPFWFIYYFSYSWDLSHRCYNMETVYCIFMAILICVMSLLRTNEANSKWAFFYDIRKPLYIKKQQGWMGRGFVEGEWSSLKNIINTKCTF